MEASFAPQSQSLGLRIWHWLDALVVVALISTFFLREALVASSRELVRGLNAAGYSIDNAAVHPLIRGLVDRLWEWHIYFGYALTALFVWSVVLMFRDKSFPRVHFDFRDVHGMIVKTGYLVFYLLQLFMILSGLTMTFGDQIGLGKSFGDALHEIHETVMWFFLAFVIAHVVGVFVVENRDQPGIVSAMINGQPREP